MESTQGKGHTRSQALSKREIQSIVAWLHGGR